MALKLGRTNRPGSGALAGKVMCVPRSMTPENSMMLQMDTHITVCGMPTHRGSVGSESRVKAESTTYRLAADQGVFQYFAHSTMMITEGLLQHSLPPPQ